MFLWIFLGTDNCLFPPTVCWGLKWVFERFSTISTQFSTVERENSVESWPNWGAAHAQKHRFPQAHSGRTASFADLRSGRAYGGHTVPLAPTARATAANGNDCILRSTGESPTEADGKPYCPPTGSTPQRPGTPRLSRLRRGPQQQTAAMASSTPQGKALQKQMGSLIAHPQGVFRKGRRKSMQDGESLPCGMSRHPSFLYINRNLLANATCFFL